MTCFAFNLGNFIFYSLLYVVNLRHHVVSRVRFVGLKVNNDGDVVEPVHICLLEVRKKLVVVVV